MDTFFARFALSNESRSRFMRHAAFWIVAWLFQAFIYGFLYNPELGPIVFIVSIGESLIYLPMQMFLAYSIIYFVLPRYIFTGKYWSAVLATVVLIIITAFLAPLTLRMAIEPFRHLINFPYWPKTIFISFMGGLRGSMTVTGFAVAIKLIKHWYLKKTENERLEREKLKTELELLKAQLNPHFMFNTLNSIYALALRNSSETAPAILQLSGLMRYMITECNTPVIALAKEIEVVKTYMELEKNRLGRRLDQAVNISGDLVDKRIAPLLLLPFVENSFKHGAFGMPEQAWLSLDIHVAHDEFRFKLINGKTPHPAIQSSGIGLKNVKKRLELLYPEAHDLRITEDSETYIVSLTLMLDKIVTPAG